MKVVRGTEAMMGRKIGKMLGEMLIGLSFGAGFAAVLWLLNTRC